MARTSYILMRWW